MSISSRRDKRVGFHEKLPQSSSVDTAAGCCVQSLLPIDDAGRRYDVVEQSSVDVDVRWFGSRHLRVVTAMTFG